MLGYFISTLAIIAGSGELGAWSWERGTGRLGDWRTLLSKFTIHYPPPSILYPLEFNPNLTIDTANGVITNPKKGITARAKLDAAGVSNVTAIKPYAHKW